MKRESKYMPVDPLFYEVIEAEKLKHHPAVVHFFTPGNEITDIKGMIQEVIKTPAHDEYLLLNTGKQARLDRIIVLNGKPGPAYDEYDSFALACLDCTGGMD